VVFFLDLELPGCDYHSQMVWVFQQMNSSTNQACQEFFSQNQSSCIFAENVSPFIITPFFPLQSRFDSWQIGNILCSTNATIINEFGRNLTNLVEDVILSDVQNGIFLDSCFHHCFEWGSIVIDGDDQASAFEGWSNGSSSQSFWFQDNEFPCNNCCSPTDKQYLSSSF